MNIPQAAVAEGDIPEIADGLYPGKFLGVESRMVEQFKTDADSYGHPDDGVRYDFPTVILDEDYNPALPANAESPDDVLVIGRTAKSVKNAKAGVQGLSAGEKSNARMYLKGILTPAEMNLWLSSGKGDAQADAMWAAAAAKVSDRIVMVQITHNPKGWPQIELFLGPAKPLKAK